MHISIVKVEYYIYVLGLELLLVGLGLGKGFGVGLVLGLVTLGLGVGFDTYKTIFVAKSTSPVAQWRSGWTCNPKVAGLIPARDIRFFFFYIIEEHPQIIVTLILKISELKSVANARDVHVVKDEGRTRNLDREGCPGAGRPNG